MRRLMLVGLMAFAITASAQQLDFKVLDKIAGKATSSTEMGFDEATLKSTAGALDKKSLEQDLAKKAVEGLNGFFLRAYEFKNGDFKLDEIKPLLDQLKAPDWKPFLRVKESNELVEMWWHVKNGIVDGMLLIAAESNELTVINAMGISKPEDLMKLKDFGVPSIGAPTK